MHRSPARAAFFFLFFGGALAGLLDGAVVASAPVVGLSPTTRLLSALYAFSPPVLVALPLAGTVGLLLALWGRTRPTSAPSRAPLSLRDAIALLMALIGFSLVYFLAAELLARRTHHRGLGAMALAVLAPVLALGTTYLWAAFRPRALESLPPTPPEAGEVESRPDAKPSTLDALVRSAGLSRLAVVLTIVAVVGAEDAVLDLEARAGVKAALVEHSLLFRPIVLQVQPIFDLDHDGYAPALGGGDCDDESALIHPGAPEIPANGIDDDCFGGDAPLLASTPSVSAGEPAASPSRPTERPRLKTRPNLLHITIDTLRADRLGAWGYRRPTSPNLDALAKRGVRFAWAFSQGAQTKVSMPSVFTGRYFSEVKRSPDAWAVIWPENVTLAERLAEAGYGTAGVPSHRYFLPSYGLQQGFADWDLSIVNRHGAKVVNVSTSNLVTDRALAFLESKGRAGTAFYLWLHYFDPHHDYQDHDQPTDFGALDTDRYDEEIRYTDQEIGRLLRGLSALGLDGSTYIVVHGDHAEGFGEHGYQFHGQNLFNDQVHVPLILAGPGLDSAVVATPVALIDVVPTLVTLSGAIGTPELPGESLLARIGPSATPRTEPVFIEMLRDANHTDRRALVDWPYKLHWSVPFDELLVFDLTTDPGEEHDLATERPDLVERLNRRMRDTMALSVHPVPPRR